MAYGATSRAVAPATIVAPGVVAIQRMLLWLAGFSCAIVIIEPSPYEVALLSAITFFAVTGLRMRAAYVPLMILLFLVNIGYTICAAYLMDKPEIVSWIFTSWYLAITALFFAMVMAQHTLERIDLLRRGLVAGAMVASLTAIIGYFHLIPGHPEMFTLYGRGSGTFRIARSGQNDRLEAYPTVLSGASSDLPRPP